MIASIISQCNLHCTGCYSRCNHATLDSAPVKQLTSEEWLRIFDEDDDLGVSFILLAGGSTGFVKNSHGGAEPCPFSPYSDINVSDTSLREALHSPLFMALQKEGVLLEDHSGGCVLHEKREQVEAILKMRQKAF